MRENGHCQALNWEIIWVTFSIILYWQPYLQMTIQIFSTVLLIHNVKLWSYLCWTHIICFLEHYNSMYPLDFSFSTSTRKPYIMLNMCIEQMVKFNDKFYIIKFSEEVHSVEQVLAKVRGQLKYFRSSNNLSSDFSANKSANLFVVCCCFQWRCQQSNISMFPNVTLYFFKTVWARFLFLLFSLRFFKERTRHSWKTWP